MTTKTRAVIGTPRSEAPLFQFYTINHHGSWILYGQPKTAEQCEAIRRTSNGFEGQHYKFETV